MSSNGYHAKEWHCNRFIPREEGKHTEENFENVIIALNSTLPSHFKYFWKRAQKRICADGGANQIFDALDSEERRMWRPHIIKGDFDSIRKEVLDTFREMGTTIIYDESQDSTDMDKCLMLTSASDRVLVIGAMGGNFTQELSNLNPLFKTPQKHIIILSDQNVVFLLAPGKHTIHFKTRFKVGLIPLGMRCNRVTTTGLKWNLDEHALEFGGMVSSSNEMVSEIATVEVSDPILWTCDFRDS